MCVAVTNNEMKYIASTYTRRPKDLNVKCLTWIIPIVYNRDKLNCKYSWRPN